MMQIIDNLLYDTADSILLAWNSDYDAGFLWFDESVDKLYATKNGRFFFHRKRYSQCFFSLNCDEWIEPCNEKVAQEFTLEHNPYNFDVVWKGKSRGLERWTKMNM